MTGKYRDGFGCIRRSAGRLSIHGSDGWRYGFKIDDLPGLVEANEGFCFDLAKVIVPLLILVTNGEYQSPEIRRQTKLCIEGLPNPTLPPSTRPLATFHFIKRPSLWYEGRSIEIP